MSKSGKKSKKTIVVKEHMFFCDQIASILDFKVSATTDTDFHVKRHYFFTFFIIPSHMKLYFNDIYCCHSYCINKTTVT